MPQSSVPHPSPAADPGALRAEIVRLQAALKVVSEQLEACIVKGEELQVSNEELQEANARLARTTEEMDALVYSTSHDLGAPVGNLRGLVQALEEYLPADLRNDACVAPLLAMMRTTLDRFGDSLKRLANFGAERRELAGTRELLDLAAVIEDVRQDLAPLLAATNGRLDVDLAGQGTLVFAPQHLRSVVYNLVSNALKYRHPDRDPVVRVRSRRERNRLVVSVQDNGLGLSESQQEQLFRLFQRLHTHVEGTGVGLYLVKKILDNAGGAIRVQSELGRGTTFTAIFPG